MQFPTKQDDRSNACTDNYCIHFYACICAFASDQKLAEEFQYYINLDQTDITNHESQNFEFNVNEADKLIEMDISDLENLSDSTHLLIFRDDTLIQNLQNDQLDIDSINPLLLTGSLDRMRDQDQNLLEDVNIISEVKIFN